MGRIKKRVHIKGDIKSFWINALFDSGASASVMNEELAKKTCNVTMLEKPREFTLLNGQVVKATGRCVYDITVRNLKDEELKFDAKVYTSEEFQRKDEENQDYMIIGAPALQEYKIDLTYSGRADDLDFTRAKKIVDQL